MTNYTKNIIIILISAVIISTSSVWVKIADVAPTVSGFYRMLIGGIILVIMCMIKQLALWNNWRYAFWLFLAALAFAFDLYFWHRSIVYVGPGLATVLGNFQVFFMALAGYLFFKERIGYGFIIGLLITLSGLFLLVGINWSNLSNQYQLGVVFGLLTAVAYTFFMLSLRHVQSQEHSLSAMANLGMMSIMCAVLMYGMVLIEGQSIVLPTTKSWVSLVILGVFCQVVGWVLITKSMPHLPTSIVGVVLLLQPALSMLWDVLFFARPTDWVDVVGLLMVLAGVYMATAKKSSD